MAGIPLTLPALRAQLAGSDHLHAKESVVLTRITGLHGSRLDIWSDPVTGKLLRVWYEHYVHFPGIAGRFETTECDISDLPQLLRRMQQADCSH